MKKYFQVSVSDSIRMQVLKQVHNLSDIKPAYLICQILHILFHEPNKLSQVTKLHHKVKLILVLKRILKLNYAWMFHDSQQLPFDHGLILLFFFMEFALDDLFHGEGMVLFVDKKDVTVGTLANDSLHLEVLKADFFL